MRMTFCLRDIGAKKSTPVYAYIHWTVNGRSFQWKLATGVRVKPNMWDQQQHRVKPGAMRADVDNSGLAQVESDVHLAFAQLNALRKPLTMDAVHAQYKRIAGDRTRWEDM